MLIAFGSFELDLVACELRREGRAIAMQPRVFDTLRYLVEHRDRIVSQQELVEVLWGGQQLNAAAVPWTVSHARKALGQSAGQHTFIRTFLRRGYRFVADVRTLDDAREASSVPAPIAASSATPFVGRTRQLEQLTAALSEAAGGRGSLVLLVGEAGIGKTRCAAELEANARSRGATVWVGRCMEHGAAPACWPFIQVLRAACADTALVPRARREMRQLLDELAPAGPGPQPPITETARFWFLDRIASALATSARNATRLIVIDDLHCADESSLHALTLLAPALAETRLLVLATAREFSSAPGTHDASALASRLRAGQVLTLNALTEEDVAAYLHTALGQTPAAELTGAFHARTGGNPLFVREALRTALERSGGAGSLCAADVPLPAAAREFVSQRLAPLSESTREVLEAASVIGNELVLALLQRTCDLSDRQLLLTLDDAVAARVLESTGGVSYRFSHALVRELTCSALSVARRAELHARVGLALEALSPVDPNVQQLAFHFHHALAAEYSERAVRYSRLAGDAAMRVYAYEEAAEFYAWALQAYAAMGAQDRATLGTLLLKHAASLMRAGKQDDARARCTQAIALAREGQLPEILVEAARLLRPSNTGAQVPDPVALAALEEALQSLPDSATAARAQTYSKLACIPPYAYRIEESKRLSDEGVRLARASGDRSLELEALGARLYALSGPDTPDELLALSDQLLDAERGPASWLVADAHIARYLTLLSVGRVEAANGALAAFGREAQALRVREWAWHQQRFLAHRVLDAGAVDEAARRFEQLFVEGRALGLRCAPAVYSAQSIALDAIRSGRNSALSPLGEEMWRWARAIPLYRAWRVVRGIAQGERLQARQEFEELVRDRCAVVTRDYAFLGTLAKLSHAAVEFGDRDAARMLEGVLTPYADRIAITDFAISLGSVSHHLGVLALFLGDFDQASRRFDVAQRANTATGHELSALHSRLALAKLVLEASSSKRAQTRARTLCTEVRDAARGCGAGGLQRSAEHLLGRLVPAARSTRPARRADA